MWMMLQYLLLTGIKVNSEKTETIKTFSILLSTAKVFKSVIKKTHVAGPRKTKCVTGVRIGKDRNNVTHEYVDSVYRQIKQSDE